MLFIGLSIGFSMQALAQTAIIEKATMSLSAQAIKQGNILCITIQTPKPMSTQTHLYFGKQIIPFYIQSQTQNKTTYQSWIGIGVDDKVGNIPISLKLPTGENLVSTQTITIQSQNFGKQNIQVSKGTKGLEPIPGEMEAIQHLKSLKTVTRYWQFPFISPTPDCENGSFGVRRYHNGIYSGNYHKGVDLKSPQDRPIKAIQDGVIIIATTKFRLHGGTVGIDHGNGVSSIYIHQSKVTVKTGDIVKAGQIIGYVGSTGFAVGPHLHWGLYVNGVPVDPNVWVPYHRC